MTKDEYINYVNNISQVILKYFDILIENITGFE